MPVFENPALKEFVAHVGKKLTLAQVLIQRSGAGYELRHADDAYSSPESLKSVKLHEARTLAQFTATGEFRPLKSAPTLQRGWRLMAASDADLESALSQLYPGAVADWHAAQSANPPVTYASGHCSGFPAAASATGSNANQPSCSVSPSPGGEGRGEGGRYTDLDLPTSSLTSAVFKNSVQMRTPVTNYREYTARQTGMYRITAMLDDVQAAQVIRSVCCPENCLKRRLWTVAGLASDGASAKSLIPCLEPCAILMESARQAVRAEQQQQQ